MDKNQHLSLNKSYSHLEELLVYKYDKAEMLFYYPMKHATLTLIRALDLSVTITIIMQQIGEISFH